MGKSSAPKTVSMLTSGQKDISGMLGMYLKNNMGQGASQWTHGGPPSFQQVGMNPLFQQIPGMLNQSGLSGYSQAGQKAISSLETAGPQDLTDWFNKSVKNPLMQTYNQVLKPQIDEGFAGVGAFSTARGKAEANAGQNLTNTMAQALSNMSMQDYQDSMQRKATGVGLENQGRAMNLQTVGQMMNLADQEQGQSNWNAANQYNSNMTKFNFGYQDFLRMTPENNPYIQQAMGYVQPISNQRYDPTHGTFGSTLGGAAGGAMSGMSMFGPLGGLLGGLLGGGVGYFG